MRNHDSRRNGLTKAEREELEEALRQAQEQAVKLLLLVVLPSAWFLLFRPDLAAIPALYHSAMNVVTWAGVVLGSGLVLSFASDAVALKRQLRAAAATCDDNP